MKTIMISAALMISTIFTWNNKLIGRWESKPSEKGNITGVVFKDSTFEGYVNKKPFVSAQYSFKDSILSFTDNGCDGKRGVYTVKFFSNGDSLRFEAIWDLCNERREGMSKLVLGRKK
jgi:hypothetical protein